MSSVKFGKVGGEILVFAWNAKIIAAESVGIPVSWAAQSLEQHEHQWDFEYYLGVEQREAHDCTNALPVAWRAAHVREGAKTGHG